MRTVDTLILQYMKTHKYITVKDAMEHCHTTELRKRLSDLKKAGYKFGYEWGWYLGCDARMIRYKKYYLIGEPQ